MKKLIVESSIEIEAPAARVWDVLTTPKLTRQYMFDCEPITNWKAGSPLNWRGAADGKIYVKGAIVSIEPGKSLRYTTFDPNGNLEDNPCNYLTVSYELKPDGDHTMLNVTQGDFATVANGEKRYHDTVKGWIYVLVQIKELAET